jgi:hypothetical protein
MFRFTIRSCCIVALALVWCTGDLAARGRRIWTYKDLLAEADIVCIGTIKSTKKTENTEFLPEYLDRFESEVGVLCMLKGDPKVEKVSFVHFKYRPDIRSTLGNGPSFPLLEDPKRADGNTASGKRKTELLFFLRRRDDGAYEPVSGNDDPDLSVALIDGTSDDK